MAVEWYEAKELLKRNHPDQFSDSLIEDIIECPRELLDFYISGLSEQNKHFDFENFIKKLLEREVCPNLIEETGPAGGGDGKVDTETYPVAESLQNFWLNGLNKGNERWAFAVSLKSDWKGKCKLDIEKIVDTKRNYTKIFFITSKPIKNNIRLDYQDKKNEETGLEVTIFDKTWILDKALKIENLDLLKMIGVGQILKEKTLGKNDYKNTQRIQEIEKKLNDYATTDTVNQDVIDLSMESAILSRNIEETEDTVNAKFQRALRLAKKKGNFVAEKEITYDICWYSHWWINNEEQFEEYYSKYENLVIEDKKIDDIEKLTNLWTLAYTRNNHDKEKTKDKTNLLLELLEEKLESKSRVTYLKASTKISIIKITLQEDVEEQFVKLIDIINEATKFKEYDFIQLSKMIEVLLPIYSKNEKYNELYDLITEVLTERKGDVQKAEMYLKKAKVLSQCKKPYDAIKLIGKSLTLFYKEETNGKLIEAYINIGANYQAIGLLYSAKNYYIAAIAMAIDCFFTENYLDPFILKILDNLIDIEISQGNVESILSWAEIRNILINVLTDKRENIDIEKLDEFLLQRDVIISSLVLKTQEQDFKKMNEIITKCKKTGLITTEVMSKYVIGIYDEELLKECNNDKEKIDTMVKETYEAAYKQNLPLPNYLNNIDNCLESSLMGNKIKVYINGSKLSYRFGEFILALIENTFGTMQSRRTIMRGDIKIILNNATGKFNFDYKFDGIETFTLNLNGLDMNDILIQEQKNISDILYKLLLNILAVNFIYDDFEETIKDLFENEKSFERAINHTNCLYNLNKIFSPEEESEYEQFEIVRKEEWHKKLKIKNKTPKEELIDLYDDSRDIIYDKPDDISFDDVPHTNIYSSNMIKCTHWDLAKWRAVLFLIDTDYKQWGKIGIVFEKLDGAKLVFEDLINYATKEDKQGKIIISFIKGINKNRKFDYRVMITNKLEIPKAKENILIQPIARFHNMNCETNINLNILENLLKNNPNAKMSIFPAIMESGNIKPLFDYEINIKQITIKEAHTISKSSVESMVITEEDEPVIPKGLSNTPIEELIELKKKLLKKNKKQ